MFNVVSDYFGYNIESDGTVYRIPRIDNTIYASLGQAEDAIEAYQTYLVENM